MSARGAAIAAGAFARTLLRSRTLRSRAALERWQARRLRAWLLRDALAVPAYADLADAIARDGLRALPRIGKADLLARFAAHNRLGLDARTALRMADAGTAPRGHAVGASTGTSGNRLPYVVSERERFVWLGTLLAKALPDAPLNRHRVAVVLPRGSALYDAANASGALRLLFVPIGDGLPAMGAALERFDPTVVVAPPRALRFMAERGTAIAPRRVVSAAEVLDPPDRSIIEAAWPRAAPIGQIYMATEGLFAVTCARGTLHLAEDCVHFELEPAGEGLVSPLVTDFTRRTQIMARYRMNDLLRPGRPCPCGSPLATIAAVEGRRDDAFEFAGTVVTPDVMRDAVVGADPAITDFRIAQTSAGAVRVTLPEATSGAAVDAARERLRAAFGRLGVDPLVEVARGPIEPPVARKLRRVERLWHGD